MEFDCDFLWNYLVFITLYGRPMLFSRDDEQSIESEERFNDY